MKRHSRKKVYILAFLLGIIFGSASFKDDTEEVICIAVIAIAVVVMLGALVPRNNQDQTIPMEDMYTGPDEGYSEGTFVIE